MKRIYYLLSLLVLAAVPATFTSCDDDPWYDDINGAWYDDYDWYDNPFEHGNNMLVSMAQTLTGSWSGTAVNDYPDNSGNRMQEKVEVDFTFVQYTLDSNNGTGFETDYIPTYDSNGNKTYKEEIRSFKWYIDPRTYDINVEYVNSKYQFRMEYPSNFFLGYDNETGWDVFKGTMTGVNNNEYIYIDLTRNLSSSAPSLAASANANTKKLSFGKANDRKIQLDNLPYGMRDR